MTANQRSWGLYLVRFKLTLCTNWSRVFSPEPGELQKVGLGCFWRYRASFPVRFLDSAANRNKRRPSLDRPREGGRGEPSAKSNAVRRQVRLQNRSILLISRNRIEHNSFSPGRRHSWREGWRTAGAGLMLSAAASAAPVAGRASHFAAQSQSHRQGRRPPPSERVASWFAFTCLDFTIAL